MYPFGIDKLQLSYDPPAFDTGRRYLALLRGVRPGDGTDVGAGWRELHRIADGQAMPGPAPRRVAASFIPTLWSGHVRLNPPGWAISFGTQALPVAAWRARDITADAQFDWLLTAPGARDPTRRFAWWADLRYRPAR